MQHGTWGERERVHRNNAELHTILWLEPNKRCSWHSHSHAYNKFFVASGEVTIKTDIGPDGQRNYTTIRKGQRFIVKPGIKHEFRTGDKPAIIYEVAYVEYDESDIHREQLGGDTGMKNESKR